MAHEISIRADGKAEMAFVNEVGWHGLGNQLEVGAPLERWVEAAGMDWDIFRAAVQYSVVNNEAGVDELTKTMMFPEKHVLYRSDTNAPLSVVSPSYKIVQPYEVLEFYRDLVGVADMQLETAGVLFGGKRFWALANTGRLAELKGGDTVKGYLLLSTSCDGTLATSAQFTSIRVVCNNTLTWANADTNTKIRVPHNRVWNPGEVKQQLGLIDDSWGKFKESIELLSNTVAPRDKAVDYLIRLYGEEDIPVEEQSFAVQQKCASVWELFTGMGMGSTLASAEGTFWGLLNAVTESIDHHTGHRTVDAQRNSAWFGPGAGFKGKAFSLAIDAAQAA